jgi:transcriptional repressor NrdR
MASDNRWHPARGRPSGMLPAAAGTVVRLPLTCTPTDRATSVAGVRCPACSALDDKVIDSRAAEDGTAIRRRRECLVCGRRFTTFERLEEIPLVVVKRSGDRVAFDRDKIESGVRAAAKGRPLTDEQIGALAGEIEDQARLRGPEVPSELIGVAVLEQLREIDKVAYVRFASVYKDFDDPSDFQREVRLLTKATAPKRH